MKKTVVIVACSLFLIPLISANAVATTISGAALGGLTYRDNGGSASFDGVNGYAVLATNDSSLNGGAPVAYVKAGNLGLASLGPLSSFSIAYAGTYGGGDGNQPYWLTYLYDPYGGYIGVVSMGGPVLDGSTAIHVFYDYAVNPQSSDTYWGQTLSQLAGTAYGSTTFGALQVYEAGVEIGVWNIAAGTPAWAHITSISSPVPEPASLLLLGTGLVGALRAVRRKRR